MLLRFETLSHHLFYNCTKTKLLWDWLKKFISNTTLSIPYLMPQSAMLGHIDLSYDYFWGGGKWEDNEYTFFLSFYYHYYYKSPFCICFVFIFIFFRFIGIFYFSNENKIKFNLYFSICILSLTFMNFDESLN